jgi:hypothetical protein
LELNELIKTCTDLVVKFGDADFNKTLDFSDKSIEAADEIIDELHEIYLHPEKSELNVKEKVKLYSLAFGMYIGEVLLRNHLTDFKWQENENGPYLYKDEGNNLNPVGKVMKQIVRGKEEGESVLLFFAFAVGLSKRG